MSKILHLKKSPKVIRNEYVSVKLPHSPCPSERALKNGQRLLLFLRRLLLYACVKRVGFTGAPFQHMLELLRCWSVRVEYPCFMGSHQRHKGFFVTHEQGHLSFPLPNKRSHSAPFL